MQFVCVSLDFPAWKHRQASECFGLPVIYVGCLSQATRRDPNIVVRDGIPCGTKFLQVLILASFAGFFRNPQK